MWSSAISCGALPVFWAMAAIEVSEVGS